MRRALAITIVLLFGFSLAAPLFAVDSASSLPECCRRNGRHHCAGAMMMADPAARTISSIAPKCPNWPKSTPAPSPNNFAATRTAGAGTPLYAHPAAAPQTAARYRVAFARSRQKRGPPVALL